MFSYLCFHSTCIFMCWPSVDHFDKKAKVTVANPALNFQIRFRINSFCHDDVIKWKHFPRYWPFVWGIHRPPVDSPHKGQWALMFSLICAWINGWVNNGEAGDFRRHRVHYDVTLILNRSQPAAYERSTCPPFYEGDTEIMMLSSIIITDANKKLLPLDKNKCFFRPSLWCFHYEHI